MQYFIGLILSLTTLSLVFASQGALPTVEAQDLNEKPYVLPADLPAKRTLVLIAYQREQQANINTWIDGMSLKESELPWLELPVLEDYGSWFQWFVDNGMRRGIKGEFNRTKVVTIYTDKDEFNASLGIANEDSIYAAVVSRDGKVIHLEAGDYSAEAEQRLRRALNTN